MNDTLHDLAHQALREPGRSMGKLYDLAQREQWRERALPWDDLNAEHIPLPLRQGAANMLIQVLHGELAAMLCSARLVDRMPTLDARLFCATQVADEARHASWFAHVLRRLDCEAQVRPVTSELMLEVHEADSLEEQVVGMQIIVEGLAHALFLEGAACLAELDYDDPTLATLAGLERVVGDFMLRTLAEDESRHAAFGTAFLAARIPELDASHRRRLEARLERWGDALAASAREPDLFDDVALPWHRFAQRCQRELNSRLERCGLDYRFNSLEG